MNDKLRIGFRRVLLTSLVALTCGCAEMGGTGGLGTGVTTGTTGTTGTTATGGGSSSTGSGSSGTNAGSSSVGSAGTAAGTGGGASTGTMATPTGTGPEVMFFEPPTNEASGITPSDKIDILFVVDNSVSMADKQEILKAAVPDLIAQLTNPPCESEDGTVSLQPATAADMCPANDPTVERPFEPVKDIHIAMVTSSLGSSGATADLGCTDATGPGDDQAHLVGSLMRSTDVPTYGGGFLAWDPAQASMPPGEADQAALVTNFQNLVDRVGETGCGFEATLEAMYRFLIEPDPRSSSTEPGVATPTDELILQQRAAFLRPDSVVAVIVLTDENDCSFNPDNKGDWLWRAGSFWGGTSTCATNPNDQCCRACVDPNSNAACTPALPSEDSACVALGAPSYALPVDQDHVNLRCFEQKRRFGVSVLHPVERYINGLADERIFDRAGNDVVNPLYAPGADGKSRSPKKVFVVGILGVPWQDVGTAETIATPGVLRLKSVAQLAADGTWTNILGDPAANVPPADPLARESVVARSGTSPVTMEALAPPDGTVWNSVNGHERNIPGNGDLQYACVFALPMPRDCATDMGPPGACDCAPPTDSNPIGFEGNPLCRVTGGTTYSSVQNYAKAYPSTRVIQVLHGLTQKATETRSAPTPVVSSICPKNAIDAATTDYGYRPVIGQLIAEVAGQIR